jgi:hypothetical protein
MISVVRTMVAGLVVGTASVTGPTLSPEIGPVRHDQRDGDLPAAQRRRPCPVGG